LAEEVFGIINGFLLFKLAEAAAVARFKFEFLLTALLFDFWGVYSLPSSS
jgi:hypothetical protein